MARKRISENDLVVSTGAAGAVPSRRKAVRRGERFTQPADTAATAAVIHVEDVHKYYDLGRLSAFGGKRWA
ncbi:MAG: hypothetical protein LAQ30_26390 [Acidobacteriia bacterium]|nr:hypothetical protein [Terriglobia bacterium]